MTAIAGVQHEGVVYIGGDSLSGEVQSHNKQVVQNPKVLRLPQPTGGLSEILIGFSWSWRIGNLLQHALDIPDHKTRWGVAKDSLEYVVRHLVPSMQKVMANAVVGADDKLNVVLGYGGRLFEIQSDFSVLEPTDHYAAVGSGYTYALGSLHTTRNMAVSPPDRITLAIEAAIEHSAFVGGPILIEHLDGAEARAA